jgi:hypothetical protein
MLLAFMVSAVSRVSIAQMATPSASVISATDMMQPSELVHLLGSGGDAKPVILQVGSRILYEQAHIPGAEYAGAAGTPSGLQVLRSRAARMQRTQPVLLYCGCCPWSKCPNIGAAYQLMHSLGFDHLKVLYIATNFGADWVDKGYPTIRGK